MLLDRVARSAERYVPPGSRVVVGVSGGADSVLLVHVLCMLRGRMDFELFVCHVHHGLRGQAADEDARFVEALAARLNVPFELRRVDVPRFKDEHVSVEMAARKLRRAALLDVARSKKASVLALAHHRDDQAETVLMRILRGTSLSGLTGMREGTVEDGILLWRPLLHVDRAMMRTYSKENGLAHREDESNADTQILRNRVRLALMPHLKMAYNPSVADALTRLAETARAEDEYLSEIAKQALDKCTLERDGTMVRADCRSVAGLHLALQRRVVTLILYCLYPKSDVPWDFATVDAILALCRERHGTVRRHFGSGLEVARVYDELIFRRLGARDLSTIVHNEAEELPIPGSLIWDAGTWQIKADYQAPPAKWERGNRTAWLDADVVGDRPVVVRTRRSGDRFRPFGVDYEKKLKDLFIDRKVPTEYRDRWPLLTVGEEIVWIPGLARSSAFALGSNTVRVLRLRAQSTWLESLERGSIDASRYPGDSVRRSGHRGESGGVGGTDLP